jgi:anti-sigma-K factor RskA
MNTAEYIASGILEQYVSGTASSQEMQEVECMSHIYPEIKEEIVAMQNALEAMAMSEAKAPPAFLRNKILDSLKELKEEDTNTSFNNIEPKNNIIEMKISNDNIDQPTAKIFNLSYSQLKVAASILLLVSAGLGTYSVYNNNKSAQEIATFQQDLQKEKNLLAAKNEQLAIVSNLNFKPVLMKGIETKSPESAATIYWNKTSQEVYINVANLPKPTEDKQYQLWAIADGKPVDMGMIDVSNYKKAFQKMKTIGNAQAFAITLEKKGGVPNPTMTEMYVMGGV